VYLRFSFHGVYHCRLCMNVVWPLLLWGAVSIGSLTLCRHISTWSGYFVPFYSFVKARTTSSMEFFPLPVRLSQNGSFRAMNRSALVQIIEGTVQLGIIIGQMKSYPGFLRSPRFTASVSRCAASSACGRASETPRGCLFLDPPTVWQAMDP
jgi:hypothetical protein